MLTFMDTILAADTHTFLAGAVLNEIIKLEVQGLLNAENGGPLVEYHGASRITAVLPDIVSILCGTVTYVKRHHREGLNSLIAFT